MILPEIETLARADLERLQSQRLSDLVDRLKGCEAPFWQAKMSGVGEVRSLADLASLPFTEKAEFRDHYPFGMLALPLTEVVRLHASSGTSGKPTIVAYTANDVAVFAEVNARALAGMGATPDDVVQVAYGYGLFTGGLGLHYGVERLGAVAVPTSGGNVRSQLTFLLDLGVTGLACTPSFALLLAEQAAAEGVMDRLRLRWGIHGAEPWSESMRAKIEQAWGGEYDACDVYGLSEVIGPGVAAECRDNKGGLHVMEDHFYPEIVDPETGEPVADGEIGELVLTSLTKEAQPVIRYRTRDLTRFLDDGCPCGRTSRRIDRLHGRADDMLIIRGVNVYPRAIESVLLEDPALSGQFAIIIDRRPTLPEMEARVELADASHASRRAEITQALEKRLATVLRLRVSVTVGDPGSVPRQEVGKAKRVFERIDDRDPLA
ncbi:MAG: phenylacetate--CoA ligase [Acidimicrobiia bacterium]|nr:MAG: phenylacetate--CoA ligase [Acidimicrobiia bacterium]